MKAKQYGLNFILHPSAFILSFRGCILSLYETENR
jgi:hypothetical protein